jgi:hypothetical protein
LQNFYQGIYTPSEDDDWGTPSRLGEDQTGTRQNEETGTTSRLGELDDDVPSRPVDEDYATAPRLPGECTTTPRLPGECTTTPRFPGECTTAPRLPGECTTAPRLPGQDYATALRIRGDGGDLDCDEADSFEDVDWALRDVNEGLLVGERPSRMAGSSGGYLMRNAMSEPCAVFKPLDEVRCVVCLHICD